MARESSVYIIKPEALRSAEKIRGRIQLEGFEIVRSARLRLGEDLITNLYSDCSEGMISASRRHLKGKVCEVGVVRSEDAVARFLALSGLSEDPARCGPRTLRRLFGRKRPKTYRGVEYFENGIHRPKSRTEARRDLRLVRRYLERASTR